MKKFGKTECPFCGKKIGIIGAWILKTQGEYHCTECGGYSNITMSRGIYPFAAVVILLGMILFVLQFFLINTYSILFLVLQFLPFFVFFLCSPFFVRLQRPPVRRRPPAPGGPPNHGHKAPPHRDPMEHTIVMDSFKNR
ncbi:hypothetical protein [Caproiciproducens sp. LBM24188]